jgi:acetyl-CoA carboxylase carboxyl transferase subunit beta
MLENATYSILSPEGFASILWKDSKRAADAARVMKITAADLKKLGMIERIISEEEPATAGNLALLSGQIRSGLQEFMQKFSSMEGTQIRDLRYDRFRKF